ncbi:MAG: hypothetical protein JW915_00850 [Chitinispirillaceae bacterium]|nr:hypothetical protein [Chitinispirillaceae bacterium]
MLVLKLYADDKLVVLIAYDPAALAENPNIVPDIIYSVNFTNDALHESGVKNLTIEPVTFKTTNNRPPNVTTWDFFTKVRNGMVLSFTEIICSEIKFLIL